MQLVVVVDLVVDARSLHVRFTASACHRGKDFKKRTQTWALLDVNSNTPDLAAVSLYEIWGSTQGSG